LPSSLEEVANWIRYSEYFIGISSGLSWLAWSVDVPVVLISGFTPEICEFTDKTLRIINKSVCNSCWEWDHFDKNNWHWCPAHAGTKRQFECTKSITATDVINKIQTWIK
jgi:autotransporter strand-loop-strand O-heptosyltransferase